MLILNRLGVLVVLILVISCCSIYGSLFNTASNEISITHSFFLNRVLIDYRLSNLLFLGTVVLSQVKFCFLDRGGYRLSIISLFASAIIVLQTELIILSCGIGRWVVRVRVRIRLLVSS
jgi:hypothetical protein